MLRLAVLAPVALALLGAAPAQAAEGWSWPLRGKVITGYRNGPDPYARGQHRGIDIGGRVGDRVTAARAGTVRFAGVAGSSGLTVSIRTADGAYDTSYLHLSRESVRKGQRVGAGDPVGAVGTTGRRSAAAPHLHFGVRRAGTRHDYVDPLDLLPPLPPPARAPEPRGVPTPVPVRVRPQPRPVPLASPRRVPVPRRVPLPHGSPARRPVPLPRRVPVPGLSPRALPRPAPVRGRAPAPRSLPRTGPVPELSREPQAAPRPAPAARHPEPAPGPDLGWALACAGLLLAAACIGGRSKDDEPKPAWRPAGLSLARLSGALRSLRP